MFGWREEEILSGSGIALAEVQQQELKNLILRSMHGEILDPQRASVKNIFGQPREVTLSFDRINDGEDDNCCVRAIIEILKDESIRQAELMEGQERLRNVTAGLQNNIEAERARLSREIHDVLGQELTGIKLDITNALSTGNGMQTSGQQKLKKLPAKIDELMVKIRSIATELRPGILDELGLRAAVEWQFVEFRKKTGISGELIFEADLPDLDKNKSTAVFRIFQESLTNILKHAKATHVLCRFESDANNLHICIADNGAGLHSKEIKSTASMGILGMKERVDILRGTFNIFSPPEGGTTVELFIPLK